MISVDRQKFFDSIKQKVTKPNHMQLFSQLSRVCICTSAWWTGEAGQRNPSFSLLGRSDLWTRKEGREGEIPVSPPHFLLASFAAVNIDVRNRKGKMRVGNDGLDCWRDDALHWMAGVNCQVNSAIWLS